MCGAPLLPRGSAKKTQAARLRGGERGRSVLLIPRAGGWKSTKRLKGEVSQTTTTQGTKRCAPGENERVRTQALKLRSLESLRAIKQLKAVALIVRVRVPSLPH